MMKGKQAGMIKKTLLIILAIIVLIIAFFAYSIFASATTSAVLYIEKGSVEVDSGNGWKAAQDEMSLSLNDKVRTLTESSASIALYEGEIIRLEENTEISIEKLTKESVTINQNSGSTWNKITKISGIEDYSVKTPTTVATVRGTGFGIKIANNVNLLVGSGKVGFKKDNEEIEVNANEKGIANETLQKLGLSQEDIDWINAQTGKDIEILKKLRLREIERHKLFVTALKTAAGITDKDITKGLDDIDNGELNEDELIEKSPIVPPSIEKIKRLNQQIRLLKGTASA